MKNVVKITYHNDTIVYLFVYVYDSFDFTGYPLLTASLGTCFDSQIFLVLKTLHFVA